MSLTRARLRPGHVCEAAVERRYARTEQPPARSTRGRGLAVLDFAASEQGLASRDRLAEAHNPAELRVRRVDGSRPTTPVFSLERAGAEPDEGATSQLPGRPAEAGIEQHEACQ